MRRGLKGVAAEDLPDLGDAELVRFDGGHWIIREGEASDDAFIVVTGSAEALCGTGESPIVLETLGPGDIFGEIGVLEERRRTGSVRTLEPTVVARLDRSAIREMLEKSDAATSGLRLLIAQRLLRTIDTLTRNN